MNSESIFADPSSTFRVETESTNDARRPPPDCILAIKPPNPDRQPLTDAELRNAKAGLWNSKFVELKFPRERKFRVDPPIPGQSIGIISFVPSQNAIPDKNGCYGVVKLRGNFGNQMDAERYGAMLMRKYDSFCEFDLVRVGQEFPLMSDNTVYTAETREINLKAIVDDISLSYIRKKKEEERREREEVEERARRLTSKETEEDKIEASTDLDYYTTLRTKKAHCQHVIEEAKKKIFEAEEAIAKVSSEIADLDVKFPSYKETYMAQYKKALESIGADAAQNPLIKYMAADADSEEVCNTTANLTISQ